MPDRRTTPSAPGPDGAEPTLPVWLAAALRRPVAADPARAARIMALVREAPRPRRAASLPLAPHRPRWARRRGVLAPGGGAALAAALALFLSAGRLGAPHASPADAVRVTVLRDTVLGDALRDTMRIVRLALAAPNAARVAAVRTDAGRRDDPTPLQRDPRTGAWTATVVVPRDAVQLAFVVDGRRVPGPSIPSARPDSPVAPTLGLPADTI